MNPLIPATVNEIVLKLFFFKDGFATKRNPTKLDMSLNKETKPSQILYALK